MRVGAAGVQGVSVRDVANVGFQLILVALAMRRVLP